MIYNEFKKDTTSVSIQVIERDDVVVLEFDKELTWIAIDPIQAIRVSEMLKAEAIGILRRKTTI